MSDRNLQAGADDEVAEPHDLLAALLRIEQTSELVAALQTLSPMQRRAVVLRHWLDLSVEETARELGVSTGTVKSHTSRGLAALHAVLTAAPAGDLVATRSTR